MGLFSRSTAEKVERRDEPIPIEVKGNILRIDDHTSIRLDQITGVKVTYTFSIDMAHHYSVWIYTMFGGEIRASMIYEAGRHNAEWVAYNLKDKIEALMSEV